MSADQAKKKKSGGFLARQAQSAKNKHKDEVKPDDVLMYTKPTEGNTTEDAVRYISFFVELH